jgi:glycosyltransferase involved in cell wall biosynthesis
MFIVAERIHQPMLSALMLLSNSHRSDPRALRKARTLIDADVKSILMLLTKDWPTDPRVRKERDSLVDAGYDVDILSDKNLSRGVRSTIKRHLRFYVRCMMESKDKEPDFIHAHDFDTLPIGVLISRLKGVPLVYDAHESYSHMIADTVPKDATRLLNFIERKLTRHATHIILANEKIGPYISDESDKWIVVMNCPEKMEHSTKPDKDKFTLGYFGSLEKGRFVQGLIDAVNMTKDWRLVIAGRGSLNLKYADNDKVQHLGHLSPQEARRQMGRCNLLSVLFEPGNENDYIGTPNRLFEAMALGIPVVANWNTYSGQITKETGCGFTIDADIFPLKDLMEHISSNPDELTERGLAGYEAWRSRYNWYAQEANLIAMYDGMNGE